MSQTRLQSFIESWANILVGYGVNLTANFLIFPLFGWRITLKQNIVVGVIYTFVSLGRSYFLRRLFNRWHQSNSDPATPARAASLSAPE